MYIIHVLHYCNSISLGHIQGSNVCNAAVMLFAGCHAGSVLHAVVAYLTYRGIIVSFQEPDPRHEGMDLIHIGYIRGL